VALALLAGTEFRADLDGDDFGRLAYIAILATVAGTAVISRFRGRFGEAFEAGAFWLLLFVTLMAGHAYRSDLLDFVDRVAGAARPGYAARSAGAAVVVRADRRGMFTVETTINGLGFRLLFDTGASTVVLTAEDAARLGLKPTPEAYGVTVFTANGKSEAAPVTLNEIVIGNIVEKNVPALVARPGALRGSLLGHSFLDRLDSYEVRGDRLSLRPRS